MPLKNLAERAAYQAAYWAAHRGEILVYQAAYRAEHKEERAARDVAYRAAHPDRVRENRRRYARGIRAKFGNLLPQLICEYCGDGWRGEPVSNIVFHHRDLEDKSFSVGLADRSWATLVGEMEKCDVLCRRCHYEVHRAMRVAAA